LTGENAFVGQVKSTRKTREHPPPAARARRVAGTFQGGIAQSLADRETRANTGPHVHQLALLREALNPTDSGPGTAQVQAAASPSNRTDMAGAVYRNVVQRVGKSDMAAVMKQMEARKGEFGVGRIGMPIPPVQAKFWSRLQELAPDPAILSVDGAAELLLSDLQLQAQEAQRQKEKQKLLREQEEESRRLEALEKLKKEQEQLSKGAPKLPGTQMKLLSFDIPLVGKGRVALYRQELGGPEHSNVLAWASHGLQPSSVPRSTKEGTTRSFGFLVRPGESLERRDDDPTSYHTYIEELQARKGAPPFSMPGSVPDLLVGPHVEGLRKKDIGPFSGVTQKSDLAVLVDFEWAPEARGIFPQAEPSSKTPYPPLSTIIDDVPGLEQYDTWLMLCCRTDPKDIEKFGRGTKHAPPSGLHPFAPSGSRSLVRPSDTPTKGGPIWRDDESTNVTRDTYRAIEEIAEDGGLDSLDIPDLLQAFEQGLPYRTRRGMLETFLRALPPGRDRLAERLTDYILEQYVEV